MICWYCHWGWTKPVHDIYERALERLDGNDSPLLFGPAHIVWEDENWDCVDRCLEKFDEWAEDLNECERGVVRQSLIELKALPYESVDVCPDEYDGRHPELYPPPEGVEMVRR